MKKLLVMMVAGLFVISMSVTALAVEYTHKAPAFTLECMDNLTVYDMDEASTKAGGVFFARTEIWDMGCTVYVTDVAADYKLENTAKERVEELKKVSDYSDIEVISEEKTETEDGTPAIKIEIEYVSAGQYEISWVELNAVKGGKRVTFFLWTMSDVEEATEYLMTLEFE